MLLTACSDEDFSKSCKETAKVFYGKNITLGSSDDSQLLDVDVFSDSNCNDADFFLLKAKQNERSIGITK